MAEEGTEIGADVAARNESERAALFIMVENFISSGELPPGLVYNVEPDEAGWHLGVSTDFPGNRDEYLATVLTRFWGSIGKSDRKKVEEAKRQAAKEAGNEGVAAIEARTREILRDRIKQEKARGGPAFSRVSPPSAPTQHHR